MEKEEMQSQLDFYVECFNEARKQVNDDQIAASIVQEVGKTLRTRMMQSERRGPSSGTHVVNGDQPASTKQLDYLKRLGVTEIPAGLSKQQASEDD